MYSRSDQMSRPATYDSRARPRGRPAPIPAPQQHGAGGRIDQQTSQIGCATLNRSSQGESNIGACPRCGRDQSATRTAIGPRIGIRPGGNRAKVFAQLVSIFMAGIS